METLLLFTIIGAIAVPIIVLLQMYTNWIERLVTVESCVNPNTTKQITRLETKMDFVLTWIAALNGEMNDKKEFEEFLKELKKVAKDKGL